MSHHPGFDLIDSPFADEPLKQAILDFRELRVPARPGDDVVLEAIRAEQPPGSMLGSSTWAKPDSLSTLVRYGVVAALLAALVIYAVGQRSDNYLLAAVEDAIAQHKTVRFVVEGKVPNQLNKVPVTCYWTLDSMHLRIEGAPDGKVRIHDYPGGRLLALDPKTKTAQVIRFDPKKYNEPKKRLEMLQVIRDERNSEASIELFDGRDYLVYRLEKQYGRQGRLTTKTTVWADLSTRLPVRIEASDRLRDLNDPQALHDGECTVNSDFVWDPAEIGSIGEFFSTTPPKGYKVEVVDE